MSDPSITFSVIIPNFNNGPTLRRALDSVLAQSLPAHEIIVVDDGSTDNSRAVAAEFGTRIRYVYQDNAGVSAARNHGARLASGSWLAFLDADDTFLPDRLQAHAAWLQREPDLDFLLADQEFRDPGGALLQMAIGGSAFGRRLRARHPGATEIALLPDDFEELIGDGFAEIRTLSVPRATFHRVGGFPLNRKIGEDLAFFVHLLMASRKGGVTDLPLAVYNIYPTSALRKDALGAQHAFVELLQALRRQSAAAAPGVRRGVRAKLRQARLSLAYLYLRQGRKRAALAAVAPLLRQPSFTALRDVASILRGLR